MSKPTKKRSASTVRAAFELRFGKLDKCSSGLTLIRWESFKAGADWQRRQRRRP